MNIALIGYGRMGKTIERIALERGHTIALIIDQGEEMTPENTKGVDVAIEFTVPSAVLKNLDFLAKHQIPTVCGTTGWLENYQEVKAKFEKNGSFLYASNFSLGVNLFFQLNEILAKTMGRFPSYKTELEEIHHTLKLDAPSGTAITLAEGVIENTSYNAWELSEDNMKYRTSGKENLPIQAFRIPDVPGTHTVRYTSEVDDIEIKHTAHSREGFALGAVVAAEFIHDKKGIFQMKDVLGIQ
ncbi:MAG: 4-hydroxy-tetrahydrodipicolinate reductase [Flavobacteriaceae bacterium]|nr:MAG: 4-hydroxy-tetrahydrodipicolinate reductase [Flavobacteriaceae bacterium]